MESTISAIVAGLVGGAGGGARVKSGFIFPILSVAYTLNSFVKMSEGHGPVLSAGPPILKKPLAVQRSTMKEGEDVRQ
jgi:hypothetical protein